MTPQPQPQPPSHLLTTSAGSCLVYFPSVRSSEAMNIKLEQGGEIIYLAENTGAGLWYNRISRDEAPAAYLMGKYVTIHSFVPSPLYIATANFSDLGSCTKQTSHRINTWTPQQPLLIAPESFAETFCVFWMDLGSAFAEGFLRSYYFPNMHFLLHFK